MQETKPLITDKEQSQLRREKLEKLRLQGKVFPNDFRRDSLAQELWDNYQATSTEELAKKSISVKLAGRIMAKRVMGKASFINIQDMSGRIQVYVQKKQLNSAELYEDFLHWDLGDIIGVVGTIFKTKTGELSVKAKELTLLTKSLLPMPEKFHGLADQELCYRQRYLDLIANPKTRRIFEIRSKLMVALRNFFDAKGFVEVETPMMQPIPGGATARPFITYHNTLDMQLYLRIAPELYLKRLVVGGMEKIFEINRNFRNEGISVKHNPEFTMVEFYQAYADYQELMGFTEELLKYLAIKVLGSYYLSYQGQKIDLNQPFKRLTLKESIIQYNPEIIAADLEDLSQARKIANRLGIKLMDSHGLGKIQYEIFEKTVEKKLQEPVFITAYPKEVSPLARTNSQDPLIADRFEFFMGGREIANGFSELNDPDEQASRFKKQAEELAEGDMEAMHYDADYITALEYGLPPTAGEGIGIDRLVMLFADVPSIRDVIFFPLLRPRT